MSLARARAALPHDPEGALDELLLAWENTRSPEVADLVDALDARFQAARPPIALVEPGDGEFRAVQRRGQRSDLGRLLAAADPTGQWAFARIGLLDSLTDPRLSRALVGFAARITPDYHHHWYTVVRVFKRIKDVRVVPALRAALERWPCPDDAYGNALKKQAADLATKLEKLDVALSPTDASLVPVLRAAIAETVVGNTPKKPVAPPARSSSTASVEEHLTSARDALASSPPAAEPALAALLTAYAGRRDAKLADLVEQVSLLVTREPLVDAPPAAALDAWLECWGAADPLDLGRLVAGLRIGTVKQIIQRLEAFGTRPHDPRIAGAAFDLLKDQPFRSRGARPLYPAALALLCATADPRVETMLDVLARDHVPADGVEGGVDFRNFFVGAVRRATKEQPRVAPSPPLDATSSALVAAVAQRSSDLARSRLTRRASHDELLRRIWADPANDETRMVYADLLMEEGQPHGELIALQIERARTGGVITPREKKLLREHAREFLGPLAPAVTLTGLEFERGFAVQVELRDKVLPEIAALTTHPAWSTVKLALAFTQMRTYPALVAHLQALGAVVVPNRQLFREHQAKRPPPAQG